MSARAFPSKNWKELKEEELVRFDPQLEVGGETYEDVTAIDYEDMLFITVIPNNFEYYLWKQEASLRQAELSIIQILYRLRQVWCASS